MTRIICFDHITNATTPLPNLLLMKRMSSNNGIIYSLFKSRSSQNKIGIQLKKVNT